MSCSFFYQGAIPPCSLCSISFLPSPATFSSPSTLWIINLSKYHSPPPSKVCFRSWLLHPHGHRHLGQAIVVWNRQAFPADEHVVTLNQDTWFIYMRWTLQEPPRPNRLVTQDNLQKGFCIAWLSRMNCIFSATLLLFSSLFRLKKAFVTFGFLQSEISFELSRHIFFMSL